MERAIFCLVAVLALVPPAAVTTADNYCCDEARSGQIVELNNSLWTKGVDTTVCFSRKKTHIILRCAQEQDFNETTLTVQLAGLGEIYLRKGKISYALAGPDSKFPFNYGKSEGGVLIHDINMPQWQLQQKYVPVKFNCAYAKNNVILRSTNIAILYAKPDDQRTCSAATPPLLSLREKRTLMLEQERLVQFCSLDKAKLYVEVDGTSALDNSRKEKDLSRVNDILKKERQPFQLESVPCLIPGHSCICFRIKANWTGASASPLHLTFDYYPSRGRRCWIHRWILAGPEAQFSASGVNVSDTETHVVFEGPALLNAQEYESVTTSWRFGNRSANKELSNSQVNGSRLSVERNKLRKFAGENITLVVAVAFKSLITAFEFSVPVPDLNPTDPNSAKLKISLIAISFFIVLTVSLGIFFYCRRRREQERTRMANDRAAENLVAPGGGPTPYPTPHHSSSLLMSRENGAALPPRRTSLSRPNF